MTRRLSRLALSRWNADLDAARAAIRGLEAQLRRAEWDLAETEVRAPHDGRTINLQLRPGSFIVNVPLAASTTFISDELRMVLASFSQSAGRRIQVGDDAEVVFVLAPGQIFAGKVAYLPKGTGTAQNAPSA